MAPLFISIPSLNLISVVHQILLLLTAVVGVAEGLRCYDGRYLPTN